MKKAVIIQRGNYYFGHTSTDKDGNVTERDPARWEPNADGPSVAVSNFDTETNETVGYADLCAAWDSHRISECVHKRLELKRYSFPTPAEWYKWAKNHEDGISLCDICEGILAGYDCHDCPVYEIKAEEESD